MKKRLTDFVRGIMFRFRTIQISESGAEDGQAAADSCFTEAGTFGSFFYHTFIGRGVQLF